MILLRLLVLSLFTAVLFALIFLCSGGICETRPVTLTGVTDTADIVRAVRRGASPLCLRLPAIGAREVEILRRRYPMLFSDCG